MSNGAPPDSGGEQKASSKLTLFVDRDTWSHVLDAALRAAAVPFVAHREIFAPDTPDTEWIEEVGRRQWVVVTRDKNIRRRPNELKAVRAANVHMFALTSGNLSAAETAEAIVKAWPAIRRHATHTPAPALFSVSRAGEVRLLR